MTAAERIVAEEQCSPATSALSDLRSVPAPGDSAADSPKLVSNEAIGQIETTYMDIEAESEEEAPVIMATLRGATAAPGNPLETPLVKTEQMAAQAAVVETVQMEEPAAVENPTKTVAAAAAADSETKVQAAFKPETEIAGIVGESELARIGERLGLLVCCDKSYGVKRWLGWDNCDGSGDNAEKMMCPPYLRGVDNLWHVLGDTYTRRCTRLPVVPRPVLSLAPRCIE